MNKEKILLGSDQLEKVYHIMETVKALNSTLKLDEVINQAMDIVLQILQIEASSLLLVEEKELVFEIAKGRAGQLLQQKYRLKIGEGIAGKVAECGQPIIVDDVNKNPYFCSRIDFDLAFQTKSILCVPLKIKDHVIGVLEVINKMDGTPFNEEDLHYMDLLATQIAIAIENARLVNRLEKTKSIVEHYNSELQKEVEIRTQELQKALDNLKKIDELKNDFMHVVAHDIRGPLTSISLFSQLLYASIEQVNPEQKEGLFTINKESKRLNRLIDDLLSFAKMQSGYLTIQKVECTLGEIIDHIYKVFEMEATAKHIHFTKLLDQPITLMADEQKLYQILSNLVSNALKYTPAEGIVNLSCQSVEMEGIAYVRFEVSDSGAGIPTEELELIFNKFEQSSSEATKHTKGTGLGLYICKEFTKLHQGQIWAENNADKGAKFIVLLPLS